MKRAVGDLNLGTNPPSPGIVENREIGEKICLSLRAPEEPYLHRQELVKLVKYVQIVEIGRGGTPSTT